MGDLSRHFSRYEFACSCDCGYDEPRQSLIDALEELHDLLRDSFFGERVELIVSGGLRCEYKNGRTKNASKNSRHLPEHADGADIKFKLNGVTQSGEFLKSFAVQIDAFYNGGIGCYFNRNHLDTRGKMARWTI